MAALDDLKAAVTAEETEIGAVLTYLKGIPALIQEAVANGASASDLEALASQITTDTTNLTAGLTAAPSETAT